MPPVKSALSAGVLLAAALLAGGCGLFHRTPQPPPVYIFEPPMFFPASPPGPMPDPVVLTPDPAAAPPWTFALEIGPPPPRPRPRRAPEREPLHPAAPEPPPPPQLNPGLSAREQTAYRGQVLATLQSARSDLRQLARRALSSTAAATRAQAGEYVRQAQAALAQGDLLRAQTLADKAETLARFLLGQ
ncbi:MAG: hypothetical protein ACRD04_13145 [Terriglobales bacterium]